MVYCDFEAKVLGFRASRDWIENLVRTLSFITFKGYADPKKTKSLTLEKFWPMERENKKREKQIANYSNPTLLRSIIEKVKNV